MEISEKKLHQLFSKTRMNRWSLFPEATPAKRASILKTKKGKEFLRSLQGKLPTIDDFQPLTYSLFRQYFRNGDRVRYQNPYFGRRNALHLAALQLLFLKDPKEKIKDIVQDFIWSICEESNWVVPAHAEREFIELDLMAVGTAVQLVEILYFLEDKLEAKVVERARFELENRVFIPYLKYGQKQWWYKGGSNWNGVCNCGVGASFLLHEKNPKRLAKAIHKVLAGMQKFLKRAFLDDGGSTEGVAYWQYGLSNPTIFSEFLRRRTGGKIDLLSTNKMKKVAAFPQKTLLSPKGYYHNFADCPSFNRFRSGLIHKLAERTGVQTLRQIPQAADNPKKGAAMEGLIGSAQKSLLPGRDFNWSLRNLLWSQKTSSEIISITDSLLPETGAAKITNSGNGKSSPKITAAIKFGNNAELHNHNDMGSYVLCCNDEIFLCDPGAGVYTKQTFNKDRYKDPFISSYFHGVPVINNKLQCDGRSFSGKLVSYIGEAKPSSKKKNEKSVCVEFSGAYGQKSLPFLQREIRLPLKRKTAEPNFFLKDNFQFRNKPSSIEEIFVTALPVSLKGNKAIIKGKNGSLELKITEPNNVKLGIESKFRELPKGDKVKFHRIRCKLPQTKEIQFCVEMNYKKRR